MRRPKFSTVTSSQTPMTSLMSWSIRTTVSPSAWRVRNSTPSWAFSVGFEAGCGLVQQEQLGLQGQGPGDLEAALVPVGQRA